MNYSKIKKYDISNGVGIRTSIFFTGCNFHCPDCFNPELWDKNSGKVFDDEVKNKLFAYLSDEHCDGLSVLGGEPLIQGMALVELLEEVREKFPNKTIWLWTGYKLDSELDETQKMILSQCDYVVDGLFKRELSGKKLRFRGSSNQIIWRNENGNFVEATDIENNDRFNK
jgi:anaerobic ribonucleoside-triphosphate reductase activating protein